MSEHPARIERRLMVLLGALYFAQGLPFGLLTKSLPALAREAGMTTEAIGLLALPALPWALKFAWSPWVDRWGAGRADHRKRWVLACQLVAVLIVLAMGLLSPQWLFGEGIWCLLLVLFLLNLCFATHDIASDGLAVRLLPAPLRGIGNSLQAGGYKTGFILGGAAMMIGVQAIGWHVTLWILACLLLLLLLPVWRFPEPVETATPREPVSWHWWWQQLLSFWWRPAMGLWLLLLLGNRIGDSFGSRMIKPMLVDHGWSLSQIGVLDLVSSIIGLLGAALAGLLLMRWRPITGLVLFGVLQAAGLLGWAWADKTSPLAVWCVSMGEQFADGLSTVALFTLMMARCRPGHEGVDYTLQACLVLMSAGLFTLVSGVSAAALGYNHHFALSAALALLAIMPAIFWRRERHE